MISISFDWHGVELSANHFSRDLTGYIAFSIGFAGNTRCRDRDVAIQLLTFESHRIIQHMAASLLASVPTCEEPARDGAGQCRCFKCSGRIVETLQRIVASEPGELIDLQYVEA